MHKFPRGVALERFDRFIFRQPDGVVKFGQMAAAILRSLPELPAVIAEEKSLVLLGLMPKNGPAAAQHFLWTERHREINLIGFPLRRSAPIEPKLCLLKPRFACACRQRFVQRPQAKPVGAMRVVKIAGGKNQMRAQPAKQFTNGFDIGFAQLPKSSRRSMVKRQVKKMQALS